MNIKEKKGISLIVLVITIVVMIILAAVIILSLSGSGIIDNAKEASKESDKANLKEAAQIAYSEWVTEYELGRTNKTAKVYIDDVLKAAGFTELERDKVKIEDRVIMVADVVFYIEDEDGDKVKYTVEKGTTWGQFAEANAWDYEQDKSGFDYSHYGAGNCLDYYERNAEKVFKVYVVIKYDVGIKSFSDNVGEKLAENPGTLIKEDEVIEDGITVYSFYTGSDEI